MITRLSLLAMVLYLSVACGFNGVVIEESSEVIAVEPEHLPAGNPPLREDTLQVRGEKVQQLHSIRVSNEL